MTTETVSHALERIRSVERRLAEHAVRPLPTALSDPDPGEEERWEAGQVWAHLAEFPAYWLDQVRQILAAHDGGATGPVPFGRLKTDAGRVGAIERERRTDPGELLRRVTAQIEELSTVLAALPAGAWEVMGLHPARGEMSVRTIVERFVLSHLEEHADQLDLLRGSLST